MPAHDSPRTRGIHRPEDDATAPLDWTDVLRELARFASDHELDAPLTVSLSGDDPTYLLVAVSGPAHAAWFEHFGEGHRRRSAGKHTQTFGDVAVTTPDSQGPVYHQSHGALASGAVIELTCFADAMLPSAVAS